MIGDGATGSAADFEIRRLKVRALFPEPFGVKKMKPLRKVEKKIVTGWLECRMMDLKKGDIVRLFEPTGEPVVFKSKTEFLTIGFPFINEQGDAAVDVE